jgi:hypothetical protein
MVLTLLGPAFGCPFLTAEFQLGLPVGNGKNALNGLAVHQGHEMPPNLLGSMPIMST